MSYSHFVSGTDGPKVLEIFNFVFQLKHCGKQVCELLLSLVKHLDITPAKHLLDLMSQIEPAAHTEQV